ncbi:MAG: hypothetical protein H6621_07035 [Halobacteriovoraceae bacterium]|nr:hypothetical protein [Halobacteriovoraceae bacterium]
MKLKSVAIGGIMLSSLAFSQQAPVLRANPFPDEMSSLIQANVTHYMQCKYTMTEKSFEQIDESIDGLREERTSDLRDNLQQAQKRLAFVEGLSRNKITDPELLNCILDEVEIYGKIVEMNEEKLDTWAHKSGWTGFKFFMKDSKESINEGLSASRSSIIGFGNRNAARFASFMSAKSKVAKKGMGIAYKDLVKTKDAAIDKTQDALENMKSEQSEGN